MASCQFFVIGDAVGEQEVGVAVEGITLPSDVQSKAQVDRCRKAAMLRRKARRFFLAARILDRPVHEAVRGQEHRATDALQGHLLLF